MAELPDELWIGGFDLGDGWQLVRVRLAGDTERPAGTLDFPRRGESDLPLENISRDGTTLRFDLPLGEKSLHVEGHLAGMELRGDVRDGQAHAPFQLVRTVNVEPARLDRYLGSYQLGPGEIISIGRSPGYLYYLDHRSGRTGALFPTPDGDLVAGPGMIMPAPVERRISFVEGPSGDVSALRHTEGNGPPRKAPKLSVYREEPASFTSGEVELSGTIFLPALPGPHPAVVLLHASGPMDRNGGSSVNRFMADLFARHGVAVLAYDKRGVGASSGDWESATFEELANDAIGGIDLLKSHPDIDPRRIGLWGMSQAGWIAAMVTARRDDVAFAILVSAAGAGVTVAEQEVHRVELSMRADGFSEEEISGALALRRLANSYARTGQGFEALQEAAMQPRVERWAPYLEQLPPPDHPGWLWLRSILDYDPLPDWARYRGPLLAVFGELDTSTPSRVVAERLDRAMRDAGNADVTIRIMPRASHMMLEAHNGSDREFPTLRRYMPGYFDLMIDWLHRHFALEHSPTAPPAAY